MKIFNFSKKDNKKQEQQEQRSILSEFSLGDTVMFGHFFNSFGVLNLSPAYRAISIITDSLASLPIKVKMNDGDCNNEVKEHPLNNVFDNKNGSNITKFNLVKKMVWDMILHGNGFAYIKRDATGTPTELVYANPDEVNVMYNANKRELYYICNRVQNGKIEPINMLHIYKDADSTGVKGISILQFGERAFNIAGNAEDNAGNFYSNGSNLAGYLKMEGQSSKEQRQEVKRTWQNNFANGEGGVAVLPMNISYNPISVNPKDAMLLESRQWSVADVARFFGVSPILLGDYSKMAYNTIEQAQLQFLTQTLQPYVEILTEEFNRKLVKKSEANIYIELDTNAILKADRNATADYYVKLLNSGVMCVNEVRNELGLSPIEGGDKHVIAYTDIQQNTINKDEQNTENNE